MDPYMKATFLPWNTQNGALFSEGFRFQYYTRNLEYYKAISAI